MRYLTFMQVAREGWLLLLLPLAAMGGAASLWLGSHWPWLLSAAICAVLVLGLRDGPRRVPPQPLGLIAPVDGRIVHRRECHDPFLDRAAIRLGILLDRDGAYYLRSPTEGTVMEIKCPRPVANMARASWLRTDEGDDLVMVVTAGSLLGQRPCNVAYGQRVGQGRRCGARRLARRLDIYIPASSRVDIALGDHVAAGSDVLATMVHNAPTSIATEAA